MTFATASTTLRVGTVVAGLALLFQLIGFATPSWARLFGGNAGLWQACVGGHCNSYPVTNSRFDAIRAMETIGFLLLLGVTGGCCLMMFAAQYRTRTFQLAFVGCAGVAGIAIQIGVFIWGVDVGAYFGYSFYLCIVGGVLSVVAAVCLCRPLGDAA